jgi:predicted  nucleic acid-binding Zn-ribbon protein|tara:strand:+ start:208 stop:435 length:228 start_codon:yes stop_codon:yes gene_type:complete
MLIHKFQEIIDRLEVIDEKLWSIKSQNRLMSTLQELADLNKKFVEILDQQSELMKRIEKNIINRTEKTEKEPFIN